MKPSRLLVLGCGRGGAEPIEPGGRGMPEDGGASAYCGREGAVTGGRGAGIARAGGRGGGAGARTTGACGGEAGACTAAGGFGASGVSGRMSSSRAIGAAGAGESIEVSGFAGGGVWTGGADCCAGS